MFVNFFYSFPNFIIDFIRKQTNNVAPLLVRTTLSYDSHYIFDYIYNIYNLINEMS